MDSNTHSTQPPEGPVLPVVPEDLAGLAAVVDDLEAEDLDRLAATRRTERVQGLRWLVDRLEGQWLKELAGVDACGPPGPTGRSRRRRRRRGCVGGCGWGRGRPVRRCGRPGRCSVAP